MKIIYIDTPEQNERTENPIIIDGETPHWRVKTLRGKVGQSLKAFLIEKWEEVKDKGVEGFYLYNVSSVDGIPDEKGNRVSALFIMMDYIKKPKIDE